MSQLSMARVRSVDPLARMALVELDGSEGTAVWMPLGDGVHAQTVQPGAECVVAMAPGGDRTVLCTTGHDPQRAALAGVSSAAASPASFAYTDGTTWQNALSVDVPTLSACQVWATGGLRSVPGLRSRRPYGSSGCSWRAWVLALAWAGAARSQIFGRCACSRRVCRCPMRARGACAYRCGPWSADRR